MQRPPQRRFPPILSARSAHEWINRVEQKRKQFAQLQLSPEQENQIARCVETEFVCSTLSLEGIDISRDRVSQLVSSSAESFHAQNDEESAAIALLESLRRIKSHTRKTGRA